MAKRIFAALPLDSTDLARDLLSAVRAAAEKVSARINEEIVVIGPELLGPIPTQLFFQEELGRVDVVVADVTRRNANVMVEVGMAQALGKPILLLAQDLADVPFHLRHLHALLYESAASSYLIPRLVDALESLLSGQRRKKADATTVADAVRKVFVSYSHADASYLNRILVHLRPIEREGLIDLWSDTKLQVGDQWREEVHEAVDSARVAILLISADFLASEFIVTDELPPLLAAAEKRGTRILPVILKPSRFLREAKLARFHALNDPKEPVIRMNEADREELYARLAEVVEQDLKD